MCGILGNSLSFVLTVLVLLFQVLAMTVGRRRLDLYTRRGIRYNYVILGFVWYILEFEIWCFMKLREKCFYKLWKINFKIFSVTSWYQSLGLRDSSTPSGVFELKLRIWDVFSKRVKDFRKTQSKRCVYDQSAPERWFPKIPLYYVILILIWCIRMLE